MSGSGGARNPSPDPALVAGSGSKTQQLALLMKKIPLAVLTTAAVVSLFAAAFGVFLGNQPIAIAGMSVVGLICAILSIIGARVDPEENPAMREAGRMALTCLSRFAAVILGLSLATGDFGIGPKPGFGADPKFDEAPSEVEVSPDLTGDGASSSGASPTAAPKSESVEEQPETDGHRAEPRGVPKSKVLTRGSENRREVRSRSASVPGGSGKEAKMPVTPAEVPEPDPGPDPAGLSDPPAPVIGS